MTTDTARALLLTSLEPRFKEIEEESLTHRSCPSGYYSCFRLDGVKASKIHLKDALSNRAFESAVGKAIETSYYLLRHQLPRDTGNLFLGVCSFSDEVSFVLENKPNYYDGRLMKLATILAGTTSAAMSIHFKPTGTDPNRPLITSFDARPVILTDLAQVRDYLLFRWLVGRRNAMSKVLRLSKVVTDEVLYQTDLKVDMKRLSELVEKHGLKDHLAKALSTFAVWRPDEDAKLRKYAVTSEADLRLTVE